MKVIIGILLALLVPMAGTLITDAPVIWPISTLIYNLGLVYSLAMVPKRAARVIVYNILAATLFIIESSFFFSYYLQNIGFNEAFFYHIRPDLIYAGIKEHLPLILGMIVCLFGFLGMVSSALVEKSATKARWTPFALGLLVLGLFISPPAKALISYVENVSSETQDLAVYENFRELLALKPAVEFSKPEKYNIVLIYAEGLDQRYFDEKVFPDLLPNLVRIRAQSADFSNVSQGIGAEWTIAGIIASQCGYPLTSSFDVYDNSLSIFKDFLPKATCLGDFLKQDGYHLTFIGGADARFAGKGDFLRSHGYSEIFDRDGLLKSLDDKSYHHQWGAFDDTLFEFAIRKFLLLSKTATPFHLALLTLDTHHPNGFLSKTCGIYGSGDNSTLNAVHCSDLLISRFIEQIRSSPFSENTIIVVQSDHLAFPNNASSLLKTSEKPNRLTFFINTPGGKNENNTNPGIHYDIAPTILDFVGYDIKGQVGFGLPLTQGPGYLPGKFEEDEWEEHSSSLMAIGRTLWNKDVTLDKDGIKFISSNLSLLMGGREFNLRSEGISEYTPASTLFIFDEKSLRLEKIKSYPFDRGLTAETLGKELLKHREKFTLVISRAMYLPGFSDPRDNPQKGAFFLGKPGGATYSWGPITGDLIIPFDLIYRLSQSKMDEQIINKRKHILQAIAGN